MNKKYLIAGSAAVFAGTVLTLLVTNGTISKRNIVQSRTETARPIATPQADPRGASLCRTISATELQSLLNGQNRAVASIFPVKKSADSTKQDFELMIMMPTVNTKKAAPAKDNFEKEAGNYVSYLKGRKLNQDKIPTNYYLILNKNMLKSKKSMQVCIDPLQGSIKIYDIEAGNIYVPNPSYSDSAGKCPPDCTTTDALYADIMYTAIRKNYN
jgi:ABC-type molybdate transport system substrate-binding protein